MEDDENRYPSIARRPAFSDQAVRLHGKVALVSAAGRGIGRGIVLALAREGADIVLNSFSEETTAAVAAEAEALGRRVLAVAGDITAPQQVTALVERALDTMGGIDILVNNVGGGAQDAVDPEHGRLAKLVAAWDGTYRLSLRAPVLMSEALAPHFRERKTGRIVNIGSNAGRYTGSERVLAYISSPQYAAMKTAISSYSQTLARRLGPYGVTVNCVCPGVVLTDAWRRNSRRVVEQLEEYRDMSPEEWFAGIAKSKYPDFLAPVPLGELPTIADVAQMVLFFTVPESRHLTGQVVAVDSGQVMTR